LAATKRLPFRAAAGGEIVSSLIHQLAGGEQDNKKVSEGSIRTLVTGFCNIFS